MKNVVLLATTTLLSLTSYTTTAQNTCQDVQGWVASDGYDCDFYAGIVGDDDNYYYDDEKGMDRCEAFSDCCFNGGHTAATACCVCGGGTLYSQCTDFTVNGTIPWADQDGKYSTPLQLHLL